MWLPVLQCVCACMCVYGCASVCVCLYVLVFMCICTRFCVLLCVYECAHVHECMFVCVFMCVRVCEYIYTYVCVCLHSIIKTSGPLCIMPLLYLSTNSTIAIRHQCLLPLLASSCELSELLMAF